MRISALCLILLLGSATPASAIVITHRPAADRGWYRGEGFHDPANLNYITGTHTVTGAPSNSYRSFFVIDLTDFDTMTEILTAELILEVPVFGMEPQGSVQTLGIFDVTTNISSLVNGTGGVAAFNDLGTGTLFGSLVVAEQDVRFGKTIHIEINADGLAALNAARGDLIAFGGHITTLTGVGQENIFSRSSEAHVTSMTLTSVVIPEPESATLCALAAATFAGCWRLRRRIAPMRSHAGHAA